MFGDRLWRSLLILIPSISHFSFFILAEFILHIILVHPVSPMLLSPLTSKSHSGASGPRSIYGRSFQTPMLRFLYPLLVYLMPPLLSNSPPSKISFHKPAEV
jgi:hypothetical protein